MSSDGRPSTSQEQLTGGTAEEKVRIAIASERGLSLWIEAGFAAFVALSMRSGAGCYRCDDRGLSSPPSQATDPNIDIKWTLVAVIFSAHERVLPLFFLSFFLSFFSTAPL